MHLAITGYSPTCSHNPTHKVALSKYTSTPRVPAHSWGLVLGQKHQALLPVRVQPDAVRGMPPLLREELDGLLA
jgi:hypothetical protein